MVGLEENRALKKSKRWAPKPHKPKKEEKADLVDQAKKMIDEKRKTRTEKKSKKTKEQKKKRYEQEEEEGDLFLDLTALQRCSDKHVDEDPQVVYLGMKNSFIHQYSSDRNLLKQKTYESNEINGGVVKDFGNTLLQSCIHGTKDENDDRANEQYQVVAHAESRVSILPLEVMLEDTDSFDIENEGSGTKELVNEAGSTVEKNKKLIAKKAKEKREQEIRAAEQRLLENDEPRTLDEHEKLVRSLPNKSQSWIKYLNFMISLTDIEKARLIAERALRTINYREEAEKLIIWGAYLDLENQHGNPREEAVMKTFQRALQYCDPKKLHLVLLNIYESAQQHRQANELLEKMIKKFKHSYKVWHRKVRNLLNQGKEGIESSVRRALLCLPPHKHVKFIRNVAILEFRRGVPDRGRSMFEELLRNHPKRTTLWRLYIDEEIKLGDREIICALFERATSLSIPPRGMKILFKKYLNYEKGNEERVEYVKRKALEYVDSLS